eukprot:COSAG02_NODE_27933_length_600_cov_0.664671_1_plen_52_part_10
MGGCNAEPMSVIYHNDMWWRVWGVAVVVEVKYQSRTLGELNIKDGLVPARRQ